jgi:hypothetical protein
MYLNPDLGAQLARQQQCQKLAAAEQHQRHQRDIAARTPTLATAPAPARRPRRLAAVIGVSQPVRLRRAGRLARTLGRQR